MEAIMETISKMYEGNISLCEPLNSGEILNSHLPEELLNILKQANGIKETWMNPYTGMAEEISWIIYSFEMMVEWTDFYRDTYSIEGTVFSDNGADEVYYIKSDGKVYSYDCVCLKEAYIADSLQTFFSIICTIKRRQ